jgi:MFS family permease
VVLTAAALAPTLPIEMVAMAAVGGVSVGFLSKGNSSLQLAASPSMRGRVMALWAVAFLGSTPIGGPIAGAVSEHFGGRAGLGLAAASCLVAAAMGVVLRRRPVAAGRHTAEP